ncbi:rhodanese-like domain-containing protein [Deinococcus cellulosilyticus]|uniref:Rhodanese n=1 Tax=Deinococcus cellulosilyticus (strain DSM 18568 / NBRC 106333 / KACC 11606 / 5516J-15) TaxID=1223518 RepID=A0A511MYC6_DEIC1|nr:rhodanese-like domain-containing protein [Deinococcus cellulosilyticus]GEM45361.1 rhodanese [Deinococcus cellulosilyticus NBRC 106333 = KACC 11606]
MTETFKIKGRISQVLSTPAADPEVARQHFAAKLTVETDPSDVHYDLQHELDSFILLDVRSSKHFEECHIKGAIGFPQSKISPESTAHFPKDKLIVTYCWGVACNGATKAAMKLAALGFQVKEMIGGIEYWRREGFEIEGTLGDAAPLVG